MDVRRSRPRRRGARATRLQKIGVEIGDYVSVWMPTGPDVVRAWFGANAAGARLRAAQPRRARAATSSTRSSSPTPKVLVAHHQLASGSSGSTPPSLEQVVIVGGPPPVGLAVARRSRSTSCSTASPTSGRQLPRPIEPWDDLSLIYTSGTTGPVEGRPGRARRVLELRELLHPPVRRRERPLPAARCRCSTRRAPASRTRCCARAARSRSAKGFSASRFWDDVRRFEATITIAIHGMVTFMLDQPRQAGRRRQPAARPSTWGRSRVTRSSRSASACGSTPRTG